MWLTGSSMHFCSASAFLGPRTMATTSFASRTVWTPTVRAILGTCIRSWSKNLLLARTVSYARVLALVRDAKLEPGSLKAMWPSSPMPARKRSMPPAVSMAASYAAHSASTSLALPLGM